MSEFRRKLIMAQKKTVPDYLAFTADGGSVSLSMTGSATPNVEYSFDKENWTTWDYSAFTIQDGETVYMRGNNSSGFSTSSSSYKTFVMQGSGTVSASGNVMSLVYYDNLAGTRGLSIPNNSCFYALFKNCSLLTTAPSLLAEDLKPNCYQNMFQSCSVLSEAPELPAMVLKAYCYTSMFQGCTNLVTATLPALSLVSQCYRYMFMNCRNLNRVKAMFTTTPGNTYTYGWLSNVSTSGTFIKNSSATWELSGVSGVPDGWTVETETV